MAEVKDGPQADSDNVDVTEAFSRLRHAFGNPENQKHLKNTASNLKDAAERSTAAGIGLATAYVKGEKPDFAKVTTPLTEVAKVFEGTEAGKSAENVTELSPDKSVNKSGAADKPSDVGAPATGEDHGWMAKLMFKFLPPGVKDWASTAAIPMVTQGQAILQNSRTKPVVKDGISSYAESMMGDNISVIPKAVKDYAELLLDAIGLGKNDDLATALSVGFISFLRTHINNFFPSLGIKGFNEASKGLPVPSPAQLLGFATNPETFLGLFKMAPGESEVDAGLFKVFKAEFGAKHNINGIENFFAGADGKPLDKVTYGQFVQSYATLGSHMLYEKKWNMSVDSKLAESANEVLKKYNITDTDGSLATGLAAASMHGAELIASLTKAPAPAAVAENRPSLPQPT